VTRFVRSTHIAALAEPLAALERDAHRLEAWGVALAEVLGGGGRVLAVGNGGSAAQAQHFTAELVGRFRDDRPPFSAIALCAESAAVTAIGNDYGLEQMFARQVEGHGRAGDVLVAFSTSGRSPNVLAAVEAADRCGLTTWALSGPPGNPLGELCDDALFVDAGSTATIQEIHLVAVHVVCDAFDRAVAW
jgi:D-sedoheptulose 7-phosphate isomerase